MQRTVARLLKVNHGGEHGAIRIYGAQIIVARLLAPTLVSDLEALQAHERRHEQLFLALMPVRNARPCRLMWLWGVGGTALGGLTALAGQRGVRLCTEVVERTVHRHLGEQLAWLDRQPTPDEPVRSVIADIREEETAHLAWAVGDRDGPTAGPLAWLIEAVVEGLIWLSTQGESARLSRELRA